MTGGLLSKDTIFNLLVREYAKSGDEDICKALVQRVFEVCGQGGEVKAGNGADISPDPSGVHGRAKQAVLAEVPAVLAKPKNKGGRPRKHPVEESLDAPYAEPLKETYKRELSILLKKHDGESFFKENFPEDYPAGELNTWLGELGSNWNVRNIQPPSSTLSNAQAKQKGDKNAGWFKGGVWAVNFGRR